MADGSQPGLALLTSETATSLKRCLPLTATLSYTLNRLWPCPERPGNLFLLGNRCFAQHLCLKQTLSLTE